MFNGVGSCLPPQLPPLPPPPQFFSPMSPPNWTTYGAFPGHSFSFPPPPFPPPPQAHQTAGILPRPPYNASSPVFGRGGRGRNGGGGSNRNNGHKWKIQRCDSCDRVYKSEETFTEHLQSHVKVAMCMLCNYRHFYIYNYYNYIYLNTSVISVTLLHYQRKSRNTVK